MTTRASYKSRIVCGNPKYKKCSGSITRNACVACETAMSNNQESVTTGQKDTRTDTGQSDPYVLLYLELSKSR